MEISLQTIGLKNNLDDLCFVLTNEMVSFLKYVYQLYPQSLFAARNFKNAVKTDFSLLKNSYYLRKKKLFKFKKNKLINFRGRWILIKNFKVMMYVVYSTIGKSYSGMVI